MQCSRYLYGLPRIGVFLVRFTTVFLIEHYPTNALNSTFFISPGFQKRTVERASLFDPSVRQSVQHSRPPTDTCRSFSVHHRTIHTIIFVRSFVWFHGVQINEGWS